MLFNRVVQVAFSRGNIYSPTMMNRQPIIISVIIINNTECTFVWFSITWTHNLRWWQSFKHELTNDQRTPIQNGTEMTVTNILYYIPHDFLLLTTTNLNSHADDNAAGKLQVKKCSYILDERVEVGWGWGLGWNTCEWFCACGTTIRFIDKTIATWRTVYQRQRQK